MDPLLGFFSIMEDVVVEAVTVVTASEVEDAAMTEVEATVEDITVGVRSFDITAGNLATLHETVGHREAVPRIQVD